MTVRIHPTLRLMLVMGLVLIAIQSGSTISLAASIPPSSITTPTRSTAPNSTTVRSVGPAAAPVFPNCVETIKPTCSNLQVFLLIDDSGSMLKSDPTKQRTEGAKNVLDILAKEYYLPAVDANAKDPTVRLPNIQVALIHFSSAVRYNSGWETINPKSLDEWATQLKAFDADLAPKIDYSKPQNTDFRTAFEAAATLAANNPQTPDCPRLVMLFTDGVPNLGVGDLNGAILNSYMQELQGIIQPAFNRSNDALFVTAFESTTSANFWNGVYKQKWEEITKDSDQLNPRRALFVPTNELASRMESIVGLTIGAQVYLLSPILGKPQQYTTSVPATADSLRLTYYTINPSASFTVTGPDGKTIQPDGKNVILTGANTPIQVLELLNPAPGSYQITTTSIGGQLTRLVRFQKITAQLASPSDAMLQFTNGQIGIQLLGPDGKPLPILPQMSIQAALTQAGKSNDLTFTPGSDTFGTAWMPFTSGKATVDACATLNDSDGTIVVLYDGPVGEINIDPVAVQAGTAEKVCVPADKDVAVPLQLINGRTQQPVAIDAPVQWTASSAASPGGTQLSSKVSEVDAKTGKYTLSFRPTSAGDVQSTVTASAVVGSVNYPFYDNTIISTGFEARRHLALILGDPKTLGDQLSVVLYRWFHPIPNDQNLVFVFGRHVFGWFGPTQVEINGRFMDTDQNLGEPGIERFAVQLISPSGGSSSETLNNWKAPDTNDYNTLVFRSPGLGLYNITVTDQGKNASCTLLASLPTQTVLLINDYWEYLIILILILLIILLILMLLVRNRNRLWGVLALIDEDEDHVLWLGRLHHQGKRDGKSRYKWEFKEPICHVCEIHVRSWDRPRHHLLITVKTSQGKQTFKRSLNHWEDCELRDGCEIVWWPEAARNKEDNGPHSDDDELVMMEVDETVEVVEDEEGNEIVVDDTVVIAEDEEGDVTEVEEVIVVEDDDTDLKAEEEVQ